MDKNTKSQRCENIIGGDRGGIGNIGDILRRHDELIS
jgi:hypothetical protein